MIASLVGQDLFIIVDELPTVGEKNKIYLVPDGKGGFVEYNYVDNKSRSFIRTTNVFDNDYLYYSEERLSFGIKSFHERKYDIIQNFLL